MDRTAMSAIVVMLAILLCATKANSLHAASTRIPDHSDQVEERAPLAKRPYETRTGNSAVDPQKNSETEYRS